MADAISRDPSAPAAGLLQRLLADGVYPTSLDCVHCGLCLTACPTYVATGRENSSPRGRIYLARGVAEGRVEPGRVFAEEAHLCLGCRACETACPSGVRYGQLLEGMREVVAQSGLRDGLAVRIERFLLREVVPKPRRLRWLLSALRLVQALGLDRLARPLLPMRLREMQALAPVVPGSAWRKRLPPFFPAEGGRRGRVLLFEGCIMPELFGRVNRATAELLAAQGFEVVVDPAVGCCGALQAHSGEMALARTLAKKNAAAVDAVDQRGPIDFVVVNSAGCGAALREAGEWIGTPGVAMGSRVRDVCELLAEVGLRGELVSAASPSGEPLRVAYDDPCHLVHAQGVRAAPRDLLREIPGLELVEHANPEACCGAAGIYNLTHIEMSKTVLRPKLDALEAVAPDVVATGNPGCMMQLERGLAGRGLDIRVVHPVELLHAAVAGCRAAASA